MLIGEEQFLFSDGNDYNVETINSEDNCNWEDVEDDADRKGFSF
jgi:hypothetical protein